MRINSKNYDKEILRIIKNVIPGCSTIYITSAYFYFSGFSLIAKSLVDKNIKLKVLVGLEADSTIHNLVKSEKSRRMHYFKKFDKKVNEEEELDKFEEQESYFIFKKKLEDGSLEIRQLNEQAHSKEYIFEYNKKNAKIFNGKGQVFLGSFNLSKSGLVTRRETAQLNHDDVTFNEAKADFDEGWKGENSIPLIDKDHLEELKIISKKFPFEQTPSPYLMFIRMLDEYYKDRSKDKIRLPRDITEDFYDNYKYQRDAIARSLEVLNEHNGVLIADVVGLGKSIIASAIANNLGKRTIVITPPHLENQWQDYLHIFKIPGSKTYRSGSIHKALDEDAPGEKLIIIDEVHKYRNDETKDYQDLYQLCHGSNGGKPNKVILLSATPFNNKPKDTFSLIKLFQIPTRSTLQTITNLSEYFEQLTRKYNSLKNEQKKGKRKKNEIDKEFKFLAEEIRKIITPLIIRRSRIDLEQIKTYREDLEKQGLYPFPKVQDPILLEYNLGNIEEIYKKTLKLISPENNKSEYKCARYKPLTYIKPECINEVLEAGGYFDDEKKGKLPSEQQNIHDFIKRMIVRRFESSTKSFFITLDRVIKSNQRVIEFYEKKGVVPIYPRHQLPDYEELFDLDRDDDVQIDTVDKESKMDKFEDKGGWFVKKNQINKNYISDVKHDLELLISIQKDWDEITKNKFVDPKIDNFKKILQKKLKDDPERKIIIFTEFSDTANYLYSKIYKDFKVLVYTSKESSNKKKKQEIAENFDASFKLKKQKNNYDVLVATDAISEGYNLHRAGTIFNFDIPYNPTRVVQRFGRINRINKKVFDKLYIYNFFPTEIGEREIGVKRITELKKMMFNAIFGEDTKVLSKHEDLVSHFQKQFSNLYKESESPETYYENIIYDTREHEREIIIKANEIAKKVKVKRKINKQDGILIFTKKGEIPRFLFSDKKNELLNLSPLEAFKIFEAKQSERHMPFDKKYVKIYEEMKNKIFERKKVSPLNKKKKDLINKLEKLSTYSKFQTYYTDMYKVVKDLDALTPRQLKVIRNITSKSCDAKIAEIEEKIPHKLLKNLLKTYDDIELKKDSLIITEQING